MKSNYRPEIDGLRAIAVIAVIFYHAQITVFGHQIFKGGFIGVDIFFVISGYLITSIILKELIHTGSFSFSHFYERRIRRILPALLFVMLVTLPFAWIYLMPKSFVDFSKSILYSLGFSSNFYFWSSGEKYGAESEFLKPFLHTWSLSIEEQFYILFPIILLIIFKYFQNYLVHTLILGFIINLGFADWGSKNHPSFNFYILSSRCWELLAGSILAYLEIKKVQKSRFEKLNLILPSVGLILIFYSILFFHDRMFHPSIFTLIPITGVSLIIWFSNKDDVIKKILSSKLFVGIGLISYSLYLWHYPIFALDRIIDLTSNSLSKTILLWTSILVISLISYYCVERPARNKNNNFKIILNLIIVSICILVISNSIVISKDGYKNRFYSSKTYDLSKFDYEKEHINFEKNYDYSNFDKRKNVLIVGNSHAEDILEILSKTNLSSKIYFNLTSPKVRKNDYQFQLSYLYKFLIEKKAVIDGYSGNFYNHLNKQYDSSELIILSTKYSVKDLMVLDDLIKILKKDNKEIIIFDNALEQIVKTSNRFNRLDYYISLHNKFPEKNILERIEQEMFNDLKRKKDINLKVKNIAKRNKIPLIQRDKIFCNIDEKRCPSVTEEGYKIYFDHCHITDRGANFFAKRIQSNQLFLKYLENTLRISLN